ncbi:MAG TPA: HAD-IA family hydrolase [Egibacteraceae bacterium]|nr:HAD-IA family hydrolase [Actinomycetota bacterium]HWB71953.1 HAD-IA family hydrolase [Egibacteraceae bacterium]
MTGDRGFAVVFDVDGTLVDSERHGHRVAFNDAFEEFDLPYRWDEEQYGRLLRVTGGQSRLRHFLEEQGEPPERADDLAARLHAHKTERFRALIDEGAIPARPGVERLLAELDADGTTVAITTTGSREWVEPLLDLLFGAGRFAAIVAGDDVADRKPDPAAYLKLLDRLGLPPEVVVAVEDSAEGVQAARAAQLACLAVVNDYTRDQDLSAAQLVVDGFGDPGEASVLHGPADLLDGGAVRPATLRGLLEVSGPGKSPTSAAGR